MFGRQLCWFLERDMQCILKWWGENKSLDQYLDDFNALRRGEEEALAVFNMRFYSVYHSMPGDHTHRDCCHGVLCHGSTFKACPSLERKEIFIFKTLF